MNDYEQDFSRFSSVPPGKFITYDNPIINKVPPMQWKVWQ